MLAQNEEMPWSEFYGRYTKNHEEFLFMHKGKELWLCLGEKGKLAYTLTSHFSSSAELITNAEYEGKALNDIWEDFVKQEKSIIEIQKGKKGVFKYTLEKQETIVPQYSDISYLGVEIQNLRGENEWICFSYLDKQIIFSRGKNDFRFTISEEYYSPHELLNKALFDGKRFKEIWDELR